MKRLVATALVALSTFGIAPAAQAAEIILVPHPSGDLSGFFGQTISTLGPFNSTFTFNVPRTSRVGATLSNFGVSGVTNINFGSAFLNGTPFNLISFITPQGEAEFGFASRLSSAGPHTLVVNGSSGGGGSFAGTVSVSPIPEPSTWALMLLGFGVVGYSLRRRRQRAKVTKVSFA
ncbi:FxDxF family PEP-CTERM protein [Sphingosinicella humi]|uniref:Ice-binding protein C-terminal domain-containing protein n=1 Tax=Allosphingosinicella humi TaxID=2068657 RepID=A0A2U2J5Q1_9SPHN|nr:FxDxF family PEP-CTERM protein [Sphingosinicella humi]PWG03660.1 hypothetical protein DF286_12815 [Sphingosinicella humi]